MPALDAIHLRQQFADDLATSDRMRRYLDNYADSMTGRLPGTAADPGVPLDTTGRALRADLLRMLKMSHVFHVTPQMQTLVAAAAETLPEADLPSAEDFPVQQGFLHVPGGLTQIDLRGRPCPTVYVMWSVWGGAAHLTYLADATHPLDAMRSGYADGKVDRITPWAGSTLRFDRPLPKTFSLGAVIPPEDAARIVTWGGGPGQPTSIMLPDGYRLGEDVQPGVTVEPVGRWLLACLRLMNQTLAQVSEVGLPTRLRKGLAKHPVRLRNSPVTVIEFRRRAGEYEPGSGREFSHRWLRRGHWRRVWFKRDDGEFAQRPVWIAPTICGDPSKPLLVRDHVNSLCR